MILAATCIGWSLLQLWYASPLPFTFNVFILNDTEMRSLHLGIGLFLAFLAYPFRKSSPRDRVPAQDWLLAVAAAYLRRVFVPVLSRAFDAAGTTDADRFLHRYRRHAVAAGGHPPGGRPAARHHRDADAGLRVCRTLDARRHSAQGHFAVQGRLALLAVDRRCLRRGGGRVGKLHLPVRAVRLAAREGRAPATTSSRSRSRSSATCAAVRRRPRSSRRG